ncbi:hypothetical protein HMPREF3091_13935 [Hafnia sp. HMSC23F03]|nr:hypothetical protein HMPREF3091_13935 [Hafnia sp. HMSC23F03]
MANSGFRVILLNIVPLRYNLRIYSFDKCKYREHQINLIPWRQCFVHIGYACVNNLKYNAKVFL